MVDQARRKRVKRVALTREQQQLAAAYFPYALKLAKPTKDLWPRQIEDLDSAAALALVEAAQSFDPGRGVKFVTFARFRVLGAIRDYQREKGRLHRLAGAPTDEHPWGYVPGPREAEALALSTPDTQIGESFRSTEEVERWLRFLPARHAYVCRAIYLDGRSQGEVARSMGCAKSRVSVLHSEAMDLLRASPRANREESLCSC